MADASAATKVTEAVPAPTVEAPLPPADTIELLIPERLRSPSPSLARLPEEPLHGASSSHGNGTVSGNNTAEPTTMGGDIADVSDDERYLLERAAERWPSAMLAGDLEEEIWDFQEGLDIPARLNTRATFRSLMEEWLQHVAGELNGDLYGDDPYFRGLHARIVALNGCDGDGGSAASMIKDLEIDDLMMPPHPREEPGQELAEELEYWPEICKKALDQYLQRLNQLQTHWGWQMDELNALLTSHLLEQPWSETVSSQLAPVKVCHVSGTGSASLLWRTLDACVQRLAEVNCGLTAAEAAAILESSCDTAPAPSTEEVDQNMDRSSCGTAPVPPTEGMDQTMDSEEDIEGSDHAAFELNDEISQQYEALYDWLSSMCDTLEKEHLPPPLKEVPEVLMEWKLVQKTLLAQDHSISLQLCQYATRAAEALVEMGFTEDQVTELRRNQIVNTEKMALSRVRPSCESAMKQLRDALGAIRLMQPAAEMASLLEQLTEEEVDTERHQTDLVLDPQAMGLLVQEIAQGYKAQLTWTPDALTAVQVAAEAFLLERFQMVHGLAQFRDGEDATADAQQLRAVAHWPEGYRM